MFVIENLSLYYSHIKSALEDAALFFPLVAAVANETQTGRVFVNNRLEPTQFYVEHSFGFAQIFGEPDALFEQELEVYFFGQPSLGVPKVRLYGTYVPNFISRDHSKVLVSERQRFTLDLPEFMRYLGGVSITKYSTQIEKVTVANVDEVELSFGLTRRFWPSEIAFVDDANGFVLREEGRLVSICYSAASAFGFDEIDVLTLPEFKRRGFGKSVVITFLQAALARGATPLWDCYTNNLPSMSLAEEIGFRPSGDAYPFFTINRQSMH
jgi:GNAT superfamily N-acetyltransferase